ncbi:MAG TPA: hypothetical protein VNJ54_00420 [Plantibacter sp.]|uniref:hypothetical protein n=1 Tax=unclassified Plantibacter TaxID=2624265 RepID=UPI002B5FE2F3|nr:hypothetical protein [Plantibacter sp.]
MNTQDTPPTGTAAVAIGIVLAGMTIAVGISAAISSGAAPPAWFVGSSFAAVVVVFAPSLIKPGPARWRMAVDTGTTRMLLGAGLVIAALALTSALIGLPPMVTTAIAAVMAGYTIGATLALITRS